MKKLLLTIISSFTFFSFNAQALYEDFLSLKLNESRELKIQLPRNYNPEDKRDYPLVLVLDGDYLFEPVAGNIDYQAYWEDIPDCIVVGVKQGAKRENDLLYDEDTYFPAQDSAAFYEFIAAELVPFIDETYNISPFRIVFGHDLSANFINYFMFKDKPLFRAYVALSPDLAPEMTNRLVKRLSILEEETFYYLATSDADIKVLREDITQCNVALSQIENSKLHFKFDNLKRKLI